MVQFIYSFSVTTPAVSLTHVVECSVPKSQVLIGGRSRNVCQAKDCAESKRHKQNYYNQREYSHIWIPSIAKIEKPFICMQLIHSDKLIHPFVKYKNNAIRMCLNYRLIGGLSNIYSREGMMFDCVEGDLNWVSRQVTGMIMCIGSGLCGTDHAGFVRGFHRSSNLRKYSCRHQFSTSTSAWNASLKSLIPMLKTP